MTEPKWKPCPSCGSIRVDEDHLQIEDKDYECLYCTDCGWVYRREEE